MKPWVQKVIDIVNEHSAQQFLYGIPKAGRKKNGWSIKDTAVRMEVSVGAVHQAIQLYAEIQKEPNICLMSKREALKNLKD